MRPLALFALASQGLLLGCNEEGLPVDPTSGADLAQANLEAAVGAVVGEAFVLQHATGLNHLLRELGVAVPARACHGGDCRPLRLDVAALLLAPGRIGDVFRRRLLSEDAVESVADDGTSVDYLLDPDRVCADDLTDPLDLSPEACRAALSQVPVRLHMTRPAENDIDLAVQVGAARLPAGYIRLHHDLAAASVELPAVAAAAGFALAEADPPRRLPAGALRGAVSASVGFEGPLTVSLRADRDLSLVAQTRFGDASLHLGAGALTAVLPGDPEGIATLEADLGAITARLPLAPHHAAHHCRPHPDGADDFACEAHGAHPPVLQLSFPGLLGLLEADFGAGEIRLTQLAFGGDPAPDAEPADDAGPGHGPHGAVDEAYFFELSFAAASDRPGLTLSSPPDEDALDLRLHQPSSAELELGLGALSPALGQFDGRYALAFADAAQPTVRLSLSADAAPVARVVAGSVTLETPAGDVSAAAGQCLSADLSALPFRVAAGLCPD